MRLSQEALAFIEYFDGLKGDGRLSDNYSIGQITLNPETCYSTKESLKNAESTATRVS